MTSEAISATLRRAWAADLDPRTLYELLRLRVEVFVVEQASAYPELDGRDLDDGTRHYWYAGPGTPQPVLGYLRLLEEPTGELRVGRVCTAAPARGRGLARKLMEAALAEVGDRACVLDAQQHLTGFYRDFGFVPDGPAYDWDGVPHVPMRRA